MCLIKMVSISTIISFSESERPIWVWWCSPLRSQLLVGWGGKILSLRTAWAIRTLSEKLANKNRNHIYNNNQKPASPARSPFSLVEFKTMTFISFSHFLIHHWVLYSILAFKTRSFHFHYILYISQFHLSLSSPSSLPSVYWIEICLHCLLYLLNIIYKASTH